MTPSLKQVVESLLSHIHTDKTNTFLSLSDWFFALVLFHFKSNDLFLSFLQHTFPSPPCPSSLPALDSESFTSESHPVRFPSPFQPPPTSFHFPSSPFVLASLSASRSGDLFPPLLLYRTLSFFCLSGHLNFLLCLTSLVSRLIPRKEGAKVLWLLLTSPFLSALSSPHHLPDFLSPPRAEFIFIEELFTRTKAQLFGSPLLLTLFALCC